MSDDVAATSLAVALSHCGLADRSNLARLLATGPDILDLLHRLSTGDVKGLAPGEGRPTVLTSAKGRIVERLSVHHLGPEGVLIVAGPDAGTHVLSHLRKFTFAENTGLTDWTADTAAWAIVGPLSSDAARAAGLPEVVPYGVAGWSHGSSRAHVVGTNGFDADGVLVICERDREAAIRGALLAGVEAAGGAAIDAATLEAWRVVRGLPARGAELNEEHNPLEAGLRDAISFTKGCYVGQEVVARLNTYDKVSRELIRLELESGATAPAPGATVRYDGRDVGVITSAVRFPGQGAAFALAYVKSRDMPKGDARLTVDDGASIRNATRVSR